MNSLKSLSGDYGNMESPPIMIHNEEGIDKRERKREKESLSVIRHYSFVDMVDGQ